MVTASGERFLRVVGRRVQAPLGQMPTRESREAMASMAQFRTRAPKGVFIYFSHEAANQDWQKWCVDAIAARNGDR